MADLPEAYPENAPGPFYIEKDMCLSCCVPETEAPDPLGYCADAEHPSVGHCYFKKQPETEDEDDRAIAAMRLSCVGAPHPTMPTPAGPAVSTPSDTGW
jgi:hypothetical protein